MAKQPVRSSRRTRTPVGHNPTSPPRDKVQPPKPRLFIGSSTGGKAVARHFDAELSDVCIPVPWWTAPEFGEMMQSTLASLLVAAARYDFALLVFTPDDDARIGAEQVWLVRDNVMFECGLFVGALGPERTFAVVQVPGPNDPEGKDTKLPSDLAGINIPRFSSVCDNEEATASIRAAAQGIRKTIRKLGKPSLDIDLTHGYSVRDSFCSLTVKAEHVNNSLRCAERLEARLDRQEGQESVTPSSGHEPGMEHDARHRRERG